MPLMTLMAEFPTWRNTGVFTEKERTPLLFHLESMAIGTNGLKIPYQDVLPFRVRHMAACAFEYGVFGGEVFIFVFSVIKIP